MTRIQQPEYGNAFLQGLVEAEVKESLERTIATFGERLNVAPICTVSWLASGAMATAIKIDRMAARDYFIAVLDRLTAETKEQTADAITRERAAFEDLALTYQMACHAAGKGKP